MRRVNRDRSFSLFLAVACLAAMTGVVAACGSLPAPSLSLLGNSNAAEEAPSIAYMPEAIPPLPEKRDPKRKAVVTASAEPAKTADVASDAAPASGTKSGGLAGLFTEAAAPGGLLGSSDGPSSVSSSQSPVSAYSNLARLIKQCWLSFSNPRLKNHKFDGEASLEGGQKARIVIYEKVEGQKLGKYAFRIDLKPEGNGSLIESENFRLTTEDSAKLRTDIARWAEGGEGCAP